MAYLQPPVFDSAVDVARVDSHREVPFLSESWIHNEWLLRETPCRVENIIGVLEQDLRNDEIDPLWSEKKQKSRAQRRAVAPQSPPARLPVPKAQMVNYGGHRVRFGPECVRRAHIAYGIYGRERGNRLTEPASLEEAGRPRPLVSAEDVRGSRVAPDLPASGAGRGSRSHC